VAGIPSIDTFSIIITEANEIMAAVHNRMPVILHSKDYNRWLEVVAGERRQLTFCVHFLLTR
jgi:putative SOS response-associated peptidase YedK